MSDAEQTANHITSGRCPFTAHLRDQSNGLIVLDNKIRAWLENNALDICVVSDAIHQKKKIPATTDYWKRRRRRTSM